MSYQPTDLPGIIRSWASDQLNQGLVQVAFNLLDNFIEGSRRNNGMIPEANIAVNATLQPWMNQIQCLNIAIVTRNWLQSCQTLGVLDASIESLNLQRPVQGPARVGVAHFMEQKFSTQEYLGIIQSSPDAKKILRQLEEIGDRKGALANTNADDFPQDAPTQRQLVRQLYEAIINYDCIIESKVRDRQEKEKMTNSYQVRNVKSLTPLEVEVLCWRMLERAHDAQNGVLRSFPWNKKCTWKYRRFPSFHERWAAIVETCKASKAAVHQMILLDTTTRLAGDPSRELNTKVANKALNATRDMQVRAGIRVLKKGEYDTVTIDGKRKLLDKNGNELEEGVPFSEGLLARCKDKRLSRKSRGRKRAAKSPETETEEEEEEEDEDSDEYEDDNDGWHKETPPKRQRSSQNANGKGKATAIPTENFDGFDFNFKTQPEFPNFNFSFTAPSNATPFPVPGLGGPTSINEFQFSGGHFGSNMVQNQFGSMGNYAPFPDSNTVGQNFPSLPASQPELNASCSNNNQIGNNQQSEDGQISCEKPNQQDRLFDDYYHFLDMPLADADKNANDFINSLANAQPLQEHGQHMIAEMGFSGLNDTDCIDPQLLTLAQNQPTSSANACIQPGVSTGEPSTGHIGDKTDEIFALQLQKCLDTDNNEPNLGNFWDAI